MYGCSSSLEPSAVHMRLAEEMNRMDRNSSRYMIIVKFISKSAFHLLCMFALNYIKLTM
jgi:hypothetical protein